MVFSFPEHIESQIAKFPKMSKMRRKWLEKGRGISNDEEEGYRVNGLVAEVCHQHEREASPRRIVRTA
jgi:hypothetical protein